MPATYFNNQRMLARLGRGHGPLLLMAVGYAYTYDAL